jgi:electron transport complex protein RnfC
MIGIETDGLGHEEPPLDAIPSDQLSTEILLERIHACGILGMGGAGFPTAQKISALKGPLKLLIINGAECEPFLTGDERILREQADDLVRAANLVAGTFEIPQTRFALETSSQAAVIALELARSRASTINAEILKLPDRYPAGGERQLIQVASGIPIPAGTHPVDHGILCINVQTLRAIDRAVTIGERVTRRVTTVTGNGIKTPANLEILIGTPIEFVIQQCGGLNPGFAQVILGGPMMGYSVSDLSVPVTQTLSGLLALQEETARETPTAALYPCIRCGACAEACPQALLPQSLHEAAQFQRIGLLRSLQIKDCIECGCCDVVCPSHIPLTETFRQGKSVVNRQIFDEDLASRAKIRFEARMERLLREQKEREIEAMERKKALGRGAQPKIHEALERARQKREQRERPKDDQEPIT